MDKQSKNISINIEKSATPNEDKSINSTIDNNSLRNGKEDIVIAPSIFVILAALFGVICSIITGFVVTKSFKETYADAFVLRYNVQIAIDDIKYAVADDTLSDEEKLISIKSSAEVLEEEITGEK